jgi:hypothetical protein
MRESANDVDIYWEKEIEGEITRIVVVCAQEPCPIPTILTDNIEKEGNRIATVLSKLGRVMPFFDTDSDFGTVVYQHGKTLVINFRDFHSIGGGNHWLFGYPIVRETVESVLDRVSEQPSIPSVIIATSTIYCAEPKKYLVKSESESTHFSKQYRSLTDEILPMFAYVSAWLADRRGIDATIVFFRASIDQIMTQQMFADGVGLFSMIELPVDIDKAQDSYDEYESEWDMGEMLEADSGLGGMFT